MSIDTELSALNGLKIQYNLERGTRPSKRVNVGTGILQHMVHCTTLTMNKAQLP